VDSEAIPAASHHDPDTGHQSGGTDLRTGFESGKEFFLFG
jgi:hypothetical protein